MKKGFFVLVLLLVLSTWVEAQFFNFPLTVKKFVRIEFQVNWIRSSPDGGGCVSYTADSGPQSLFLTEPDGTTLQHVVNAGQVVFVCGDVAHIPRINWSNWLPLIAKVFDLGFWSLMTPAGQPIDLHRFWDGVITSSSNLTRLRNEATALRNRQEFQRSQLTELANTDFESWARESYEIATKIAYRNGQAIGIPKSGAIDCTMVAAAPVLPVGYVGSASRIADRRMIPARGYRLADLLRVLS